MLAECRRLAAAEGLEPTLYAQALHELELPRPLRDDRLLRHVRAREYPRAGRAGARAGSTTSSSRAACWLWTSRRPGATWPRSPSRSRTTLRPSGAQGSDGCEYALRSRCPRRRPGGAPGDESDPSVAVARRRARRRGGARPDRVGLRQGRADALLLERAGFVDVEVRDGESAWGQRDDRLPGSTPSAWCRLARSFEATMPRMRTRPRPGLFSFSKEETEHGDDREQAPGDVRPRRAQAGAEGDREAEGRVRPLLVHRSRGSPEELCDHPERARGGARRRDGLRRLVDHRLQRDRGVGHGRDPRPRDLPDHAARARARPRSSAA